LVRVLTTLDLRTVNHSVRRPSRDRSGTVHGHVAFELLLKMKKNGQFPGDLALFRDDSNSSVGIILSPHNGSLVKVVDLWD
jgi:hypothetical protein